MAVTLYTGGCRSGKSNLALEMAREVSESVCFIATCVPQDDEMHLRVKKHQQERPSSWRLIEEPLNLAGAISAVDRKNFPVVLVDCLTLWICNLMCAENDPLGCENQMAIEAEKIIDSARQYGGDVIFVSNEVGMGIMPVNAMSRNYADLAGRCNQVIAKGADKVIFVSCGIGIKLK
ncbi:MAG: bifunctional adenosylcobinamide kinase/adenosylcobinamide-phosphate guanylyltransferase [Planctomycetes bacterium]|nr:bifunctional adenosylcobinamide kinase/adenosylcobinamide-phosphate guanylyltransferase [Planctomycetota bacterium]